MKYTPIFLSIPLLAMMGLMLSCNSDDDVPDPEAGTGFLKLDISLRVEQSAARFTEVSTSDFIVKIYRLEDGQPDQLVHEFARYADMSEEVELPTGTYFVEVQNIDPPAAAAFEQPWYYGASDPFNIIKEDDTMVTVECELANYLVSFEYSQNVLDDFTTWNANATRMISGDILEWAKDDDREGYFLPGDPVEALSIEVQLTFESPFDETTIVRDFSTSIDSPEPTTLYQIYVDATLEDGTISLAINVNDHYDTVVIAINPTAELVLWNKLGSEIEVTNSELGPSGTIVGLVNFDNDVKFGKGVTPNDGDARDGIDFPSTLVDSEKGTIELWAIFFEPPTPSYYGVYGFVNVGYANQNPVSFFWHNPSELLAGLTFGGTQRVAQIFDFNPAINTPIHLAMVWDREGIDESGDYIRIYVDGALVGANNTDNDWGTDNSGGFLRVAAPWDEDFATDRYAVDNIKIWNDVKTEFEDRFVE